MESNWVRPLTCASERARPPRNLLSVNNSANDVTLRAKATRRNTGHIGSLRTGENLGAMRCMLFSGGWRDRAANATPGDVLMKAPRAQRERQSLCPPWHGLLLAGELPAGLEGVQQQVH